MVVFVHCTLVFVQPKREEASPRKEEPARPPQTAGSAAREAAAAASSPPSSPAPSKCLCQSLRGAGCAEGGGAAARKNLGPEPSGEASGSRLCGLEEGAGAERAIQFCAPPTLACCEAAGPDHMLWGS